MITTILPMAFSEDASSLDQQWRAITFLFGLYPTGAPASMGGMEDNNLVWPGQTPGARCSRSGIWMPGEHLTTDGRGRLVGDHFVTEGQEVPPIPPFPPMQRGQGL